LKCFTTLVTYTSERSIPASTRAWSSSFPAGPTNGRPARSSRSPGCSPTSMMVASARPSPKTVCVAAFQRSQALHEAAAWRRHGSAAACACRGSGERLRDGMREAPRLCLSAFLMDSIKSRPAKGHQGAQRKGSRIHTILPVLRTRCLDTGAWGTHFHLQHP